MKKCEDESDTERIMLSSERRQRQEKIAELDELTDDSEVHDKAGLWFDGYYDTTDVHDGLQYVTKKRAGLNPPKFKIPRTTDERIELSEFFDNNYKQYITRKEDEIYSNSVNIQTGPRSNQDTNQSSVSQLSLNYGQNQDLPIGSNR